MQHRFIQKYVPWKLYLTESFNEVLLIPLLYIMYKIFTYVFLYYSNGYLDLFGNQIIGHIIFYTMMTTILFSLFLFAVFMYHKTKAFPLTDEYKFATRNKVDESFLIVSENSNLDPKIRSLARGYMRGMINGRAWAIPTQYHYSYWPVTIISLILIAITFHYRNTMNTDVANILLFAMITFTVLTTIAHLFNNFRFSKWYVTEKVTIFHINTKPSLVGRSATAVYIEAGNKDYLWAGKVITGFYDNYFLELKPGVDMINVRYKKGKKEKFKFEVSHKKCWHVPLSH